MFFLQKEDWSPRFESTFFTISMDTREIHNTVPPVEIPLTSSQDSCTTVNSLYYKGKETFPAVYFNVKVQCVHQVLILPRRYSQFRQLYDEVCSSPPPPNSHQQTTLNNSNKDEDKLSFPPKTCYFQSVDEEFLDVRQEELYNFMVMLLKRAGYANHPSVIDFLKLDIFTKNYF